MARLNTSVPSTNVSDTLRLRATTRSPSVSPVEASDSSSGALSDKENAGPSSKSKGSARKRKSDHILMSDPLRGPETKRLRHDKRSNGTPSQAVKQRQQELDAQGDKDYYDPDQDEQQKRVTKKSLRELVAKVNDSKSEYLQPNSRGIEETLKEADRLYKDVKQTSVATIDSKLLVTVGDLAYRKVNTLALGDSSTGIDVDDFVTKCISFMRAGRESARTDGVVTQSSQQSRRQWPQVGPQAEYDEDDDTEPMDWAYLGRSAAFLYNSRPSLSGFLLGPLSVQKKARQQTQRRARQTQTDVTQTARPLELNEEDLEKQESANLTVICGKIARLLEKTISQGQTRVEEEYDQLGDDVSDDVVRVLMGKHGLTDNGCVPLFNFCVNPRSFGQTVENMFYVSFLIKEGKVGLDFDSNGLPTLGIAEQKSVKERQETQRNQAVFTLDFDIWQELVQSFSIHASIIPHRTEEEWDDGVLQDAAG